MVRDEHAPVKCLITWLPNKNRLRASTCEDKITIGKVAFVIGCTMTDRRTGTLAGANRLRVGGESEIFSERQRNGDRETVSFVGDVA